MKMKEREQLKKMFDKLYARHREIHNLPLDQWEENKAEAFSLTGAMATINYAMDNSTDEQLLKSLRKQS